MKLLISGLHLAKYNDRPLIDFQMPEELFWAGMILIALISLVFGRGPKSREAAGAPSNLEIFDEELESSDEQETVDGDNQKHDGTDPPDASETDER